MGRVVRICLPALTFPHEPGNDEMPDAVWMRALSHARHHPRGRGDCADGPGRSRLPPPSGRPVAPLEYAAAFDQVQEQLHAGDSYEVNLTYRRRVRPRLDPVAAYLRLRELNPAPYAGFLQHDGPSWLLSASPERYATDRPATGCWRPSRSRGRRRAARRRSEDEQLAPPSWPTDPKFRAENLMIVDLLRNDLSMVCEPGTVEVPGADGGGVLHDGAPARLDGPRPAARRASTTVGALRALFPAGSMTGAPKLRTMQVIEAVEATPRGVVRRRVRLDLRRRPRRPRGGDPVADHGR